MAIQTQARSAAPRYSADELIRNQQQALSGRSNFESYWQSLHDYFYLESQDVNKSYAAGTELDPSYLWDSTTLESADVFASGFMNYLTPPTSKWFRLRHKNPNLSENKAIYDFLESVTDEVNYTINRSNFYDQMFPSYKSSGVYGTSLIFAEEDLQDDVRFHNMPLKQCVIVEDAKGRAHEYYIEFEYTALQAATRWGIESLSKEMQDEVKERAPEKKHKFLLFIGKRHVREIQKENKQNLPVAAVWIDVKGRKIVEESGYNEFPAMVHRFDKRPFIPWGFSPAMKALPFARILNTVAKTNLRSMMKLTDPPIALPDNAFLVPFNTNPRAVNYYKKDAMTGKDIFPFGNYGDPQAGLNTLEYYSMKVKALMYNDVFMKFSNIGKQMNNPEAMELMNEKMTMLGPAVGRYMSEVLNLVVQRVIGILWRKGRLPELPDEMRMDPGYEIDFVGILAQAQRRTELNTLMTGLGVLGQMAQYSPDVLDKVDPDKVVDEVWSITGAPVHTLRDDAEIQKIREGRAENQMKMQELQSAQVGAVAGKDAAQAEKTMAEAKAMGAIK